MRRRSSPDLRTETGEQEEQFEREQFDAVCELWLAEGAQPQRQSLQAGGAAGGQETRRAALSTQVTQTLGGLLDHWGTHGGTGRVSVCAWGGGVTDRTLSIQ